jgi:hypothetical protein
LHIVYSSSIAALTFFDTKSIVKCYWQICTRPSPFLWFEYLKHEKQILSRKLSWLTTGSPPSLVVLLSWTNYALDQLPLFFFFFSSKHAFNFSKLASTEVGTDRPPINTD